MAESSTSNKVYPNLVFISSRVNILPTQSEFSVTNLEKVTMEPRLIGNQGGGGASHWPEEVSICERSEEKVSINSVASMTRNTG